MAKVPFGFTFVLYDKGNIISEFLALVSLAPVFAMCVYTCFIIFEGGKRRILVYYHSFSLRTLNFLFFKKEYLDVWRNAI